MELSDSNLLVNRDWDLLYLSSIFDAEFYDFTEMWCSDITDSDLVTEVNKLETYCPVVEDISMDDTELCTAVEKIEEE